MAEFHPIPTNSKFIDLSGRKFGVITVVSYAGKHKGVPLWNCVCDSGSSHTMFGSNIKRNKGCPCTRMAFLRSGIRTSHRMAKHPLYKLRNGIIQRCTNPNNEHFSDYGARGIRICLGWKSDFMNFYNDVNPRPSGTMCNGKKAKYWIDRIDNDGSYSCGHCKECIENKWPKNWKWSTINDQANNRRNNVFIEFNGEKRSLIELASIMKVRPGVLRCRINRGMNVEQILASPKRNARIEFKGQSKTLHEWASYLEKKYSALYCRIKRGWSIEDALSTPIRTSQS